jgi:Vault protein inter-alpha-trypsin domain
MATTHAQYGYNLRLNTVERIPSGIFFNAYHLRDEPDLTSVYEKGVNPLHFPVPDADNSGFKSPPDGYDHANSVLFSENKDSGRGEEGGQYTRCLPILDVNIDVDIKSTIAKTLVTQTFTNLSGYTIKGANYSFPLYDESAVIEFRCHIGEDTVLEGAVRPKDVRIFLINVYPCPLAISNKHGRSRGQSSWNR